MSIFPIATLVLLCAALPLSAADLETGQHPAKMERTVNGDAVKLDYLLYLPADFGKDPKKKWPMILFLHGSGERGTDLMKVKTHGLPQNLEKETNFPFIVLSPQCGTGHNWLNSELNALLDEALAKYPVDPDRVYLTGLSMGGFGTWALAAERPDRFAAIAPMCGGGKPSDASKIKNLPIWVFHGEKDTSVPIKRSEEMVDALKAIGADVRFTRYPDAGHDCWTASYANPELYTWLLSHQRGEKPSPASQPAN